MYNNEYCFNIVKDARASFLALTAEEQAMVSNGTILAEKIVALTAAMGVDPDFTKTYSEHFATEEPVVDDPNGNDTDDHNTNGTITIIIVIAGAVVLLAGAVAVALVLVKKNKAVKVVAEAGNTAAETEEVTEAAQISEETTDDTSSTEVEDN